MAWEERKKVTQLRRRLLALELRELDMHLRAWHHEPPFEKAAMTLDVLNDERQRQLRLLDEYESRYLIRKAQSWGIEVPYKREWYTVESKNPDSANMPGETVMVFQDWLNEIGKAVVTKQIRDERFAYWRGWAQILIPIMSLAVAIIALLKK